jgi:peptidoglycan hydrolase CwlO-like protein
MLTETTFTILVSSVTGVFTYLVGRNRKQKEVDSITLQNLEKSVDIYNRIIGDLSEQIIKLNAKINDLEEKVDNLLAENLELKKLMKLHDSKVKSI